jgi:hypothetical protein
MECAPTGYPVTDLPFVCPTLPVADGAHHLISAPPRSNAARTMQLELEKCPRAACGVKVDYPSNLREKKKKNNKVTENCMSHGKSQRNEGKGGRTY